MEVCLLRSTPTPPPSLEPQLQAPDAQVQAALNGLALKLVDSLFHDARNPLNAIAIHLEVLTEKMGGTESGKQSTRDPGSSDPSGRGSEELFRVPGIEEARGGHLEILGSGRPIP